MRIESVTPIERDCLAAVDRSFFVESRLAVSARCGNLTYEVDAVSQPYVKTYPPAACPSANATTVTFVARQGTRLLGRIDVSPHWTGFASVHDLAVDAGARRRGVGSALIDTVQHWATKEAFPGIAVETQDNNVGACTLYEKSGFRLAGFDTLLYSATSEFVAEVALFWYWHSTKGARED
jgi:ribosomal protein S18 acetylase RimI-like enzyme